MKRAIVAFGLALTWNAASAELSAQQPPAVAIRFVMGEPTYVSEYTAPEKQQIETAAAEALAKKLSANIGFLKFITGTPADYILTFILARRNPNAPGADDVGFHARLAGPLLQPRNYYWLQFRPQEAFNFRKGKPAEMVAEITLKTADADTEPLTKELLSQIPITKVGYHLPGTRPGWVLPFKRKDLCLDPKSSFRIQNKIQTSVGEEVLTFLVDATAVFNPTGPIPQNIKADRHSVLGFARSPQPGLDVLKGSPSGVQVQAVFMDRYQFDLGVCAPIVDPLGAFTRPGGLP